MESFLRWCSSVSRWLAWFGGATLLLSAGLISLDVIFRGLWNVTYFESFELSTYAFAIATAMGMSFALVSKAHIRIEIVYVNLPPRWRAWLDVFSYVGLALTTGVLLYWATQTVWANWEMGARSRSALAVSLYIPQSLWLLGLFWFALLAFAYAIYGLMLCITGRYNKAAQLMGMSTLEEEVEVYAPHLERKP